MLGVGGAYQAGHWVLFFLCQCPNPPAGGNITQQPLNPVSLNKRERNTIAATDPSTNPSTDKQSAPPPQLSITSSSEEGDQITMTARERGVKRTCNGGENKSEADL